jgi:hypothetical protein
MSATWKGFLALCHGLVAMFAPAAAILLIVSVAYSFWEQSQRDSAALAGNAYRYEELEFDGDGHALIRVRTTGPEQWLDADRNPIEKPTRLILPAGNLPRRPFESLRFQANGRFNEVEALPLTYPESLDVDWFLVLTDRARGRAQFEGYHRQSGRRVGWIGINGFVETPLADDAKFPVSASSFLSWTNQILLTAEQVDWKTRYIDAPRTTRGEAPLGKHEVILLSGEQLFLIDLANRTAEPLLPGEAVYSVDSTAPPRRIKMLKDPDGDNATEILELEPLIVARTADRVVLLSPRTKYRKDFPVPEEVRDRDFQIYLPADGSLVMQMWRKTPAQQLAASPGVIPIDVMALAADGHTLRFEEIPLQRSAYIAVSDAARFSAPVLGIPAPLVSTFLPAVFIAWEYSLPFVAALSKAFEMVWPAILTTFVVSAGFTWWAARRQRNLGLPPSIPWLAFIFLLGPAGFIAWLVHRRWPIRTTVPPPKPVGIEVFG